MTTMYDVVDRLRSGAALTKAEREAHELAACGTLRDLQDELDRLVADTYGWAWPEPSAATLERLVVLHDRRVEEERADTVRWLRPDYRRPRFGKQTELGTDATPADVVAVGPVAAPVARAPWPGDAIGQITALRTLTAARALTAGEATSHFAGARRALVARHLETLAILGEVQLVGKGRYVAPPR